MTSEQKKPDNAAFANKDAKNKKVFQEFKYAETID
jgi:hypothetical protein